MLQILMHDTSHRTSRGVALRCELASYGWARTEYLGTSRARDDRADVPAVASPPLGTSIESAERVGRTDD